MKVKIYNNKKSLDLKVFDKPKKVYIPLISGKDKDISILVKKKEYVYKGSIIAKSKGDLRIPIHSSVSGIVLDFVEKTGYDGEKVKCIVIENDFKEKIETKAIKKEINKYTKEEFIDNIKENGIVGLGGNGFPSYVKYSGKVKKLIVNAVECEPYVTADYCLCKEKTEEILEAIDAIVEINKMDEAIIAISKDNIELQEAFESFIGTYLKIRVETVSDTYPSGWERILVETITGEQYKKYPTEKGIVVNNVSTIYAIYESLKYNKPLIDRIVTFTGDGLDNKYNMLVKIGTPVSDILKILGLKGNLIVSGGPMMGSVVDLDSVICANNNCMLVTDKKLDIPKRCIKCGKCASVCPAKLSPVLIMNFKCKNDKDKEKLKKLHPNRCVECGLCSYMCPSKINVREAVKNKKEILGDK